MFEIAYDGITIVVNKENTFLTCLNTETLKMLWRKDNPAMTWADLSADFPAETISLYGPGTDSGTFDFFVQTILGEDPVHENFTPTRTITSWLKASRNPNALGYFGFASYENNQDKLTAVAVDSGDGNCVTQVPTRSATGSYKPLSRPLYVYVSPKSLERPEVQEFMRFTSRMRQP